MDMGRGNTLNRQDYTFFLDQRALAAFTAMAFLLLAGSASALAFPPLRPPLRPIEARYSVTDSVCLGSSVESSTIAAALWFGSRGNFLLERLMQVIIAGIESGV
jgi:hypothetical protein